MFFLAPVSLYSTSLLGGPHGDRGLLIRGCGSCHKGHGVYNSPMLTEEKDVFCFRCHGHSAVVEKTKKDRDLADNVITDDIQLEFEKTYHHPIENSKAYPFWEFSRILPETDPSMPRQVNCVDCHHYHYVTKENKLAWVKGFDRYQRTVNNINFEYEICFKCHSYSANLPSDQTNKAILFGAANPSYHPIIEKGKNTNVPSLIPPWRTDSIIKCTDCHNNDDTIGPRGPHGSKYRHLLAKNFVDTDGVESYTQYELCYSCHDRMSILGNRSFPLHYYHIVTVGTSCRTCHNPMGSTINSHLIDFGNIIGTYQKLGPGSGQCFLTCHGYDHNPKEYYPGMKPVSSSSTNSSSPQEFSIPVPRPLLQR